MKTIELKKYGIILTGRPFGVQAFAELKKSVEGEVPPIATPLKNTTKRRSILSKLYASASWVRYSSRASPKR